MKNKNLILSIVGVFLGIMVLPNVAWGQQIILRYAGQMPATHHLTKADFRLAKSVGEKTNGKLKIDVYPAGQLYKGGSILKSVMSGAIDMGITYNGTWTGSVPLMDVFDVPFLFKDYQEVKKAWQGKIGDKLREKMEKYGVKTLGFGAYGESFSVINRKKPLKRPEDFKGLKIRANQPMAADSLKALGASPVMMSSSEVYMALQRGTVDGASSGSTSFLKRKWFEVTKYTTITYSSYSLWPIMINLKVWNRLPKEFQNVLQEAALDHQNYTVQMADGEDEKAIKFLSGAQEVYFLTNEDVKVWEKALKPVREKFLKRTGEDGETILRWISES